MPKHPVASTVKFVRAHKVAVTAVVTASAMYALQRTALNQHDDFLKEHGLFEAFYTPEA